MKIFMKWLKEWEADEVNREVIEKFRLQDRVALVTGAGRNLGRAIALSLAEAGAHVAVTSRTLSEIERTEGEIKAKGQNALAIPMDVTDFNQVEKAVQKIISEFGRIDILVNNAATRSYKSLIEISELEWRSVIDTNLTGAFFCCKAVGPVMIRQMGGRIINISSRVGLQGMANRVAYCASKGGLIQLTRALALEWAPYHILVNSVAPGLMNTPEMGKAIQERQAAIPLKRAGEPEEIAPLVVYLASEACSYMTGEVIIIDGGWAVQ
jgi:NAD(P)-dependent dehydrogenase (short-subunit alcohol dehydrogenase family)